MINTLDRVPQKRIAKKTILFNYRTVIKLIVGYLVLKYKQYKMEIYQPFMITLHF